MSKILVVFRVDSSTKMGSGHLMRCLTLADELKRRKYNITFICRGLEGNLIPLIEYLVLILPKDDDFQSNDLYLNWLGATQEQDLEQTIKIIPKNTDLLIIDSYALDKTWHKKLRPYSKKIMAIDDLADRKFDCDIVLNQNLGTQKKDYKGKVSDDCELLLGCDYALLRPEFQNLRKIALEKRKNTKEIKNILISVGGSDINNLTYDILQGVNDNLNVTVVLGESSPYNKAIQNYAKDRNIKVIINANNMAELMLEADLSIGAGGSTSWERCCLGLPTLLFVTDDNQIIIADRLEQQGSVKIVDNLGKDLDYILTNFFIWQIMSERAQTVCDGAGIKRIKI
jgi:UDP-2,4-diacetamido-2,4,6-trideoxy-beta-L-altropyranose hydrolase